MFDMDRVMEIKEKKSYLQHPEGCDCAICQYLGKAPSKPVVVKTRVKAKHKSGTKRLKGRTNDVCGHLQLEHYAQGKCSKCWHRDRYIPRKKAHKYPENVCGHKNRKQKGLGMCSSCYQAFHKNDAPRAWNCPHITKPNHAKGRCRVCYGIYREEMKKREVLVL